MRNETTTTTWQAHVFDYLMVTNAAGQFVPVLAESWDRVDDVTWVFKLRKGVKFTNGEPFNATQAAYSILRARDHTASQHKHYVVSVADAKAIDEHTLQVTTKGPFPMLIMSLKTIAMVPQGEIEKVGDEAFAQKPVGTGVYKMVNWIRSDHMTLIANPDYWGEQPDFQKVRFRPIPDSATRLAALLSGEIHVAESISAEDLPRVEQSPKLYVAATPSVRFIYLTFGQYRETGSDGSFLPDKKNPFMDPRVRKAVAYGVNVPEIIEHVHGGYGEPASQPLHYNSFGYNPDIKVKQYDPAKAKQLLAEAGYPNGFKIRLDATNDRYVNDKQVAEVIGGQLTKIGIEVEVNAFSKSNFFPDMDAGKFSIFMGGWGTDNVSASMNALFHTKGDGFGGTNRARYSNPTVDALIQQGNTTMDDKAREKIFQEALRIITEEDQAWVPLYYEGILFGVANRVDMEARFDEVVFAWEMKIKK